MNTIWINARFLERPVTGVERVARETLQALSERLGADGVCQIGKQAYQFKLIAPAKSTAASAWPNLPLLKAGWGSGHLWEQSSLLALTKGQPLLSLCNTGPVLKRRHAIFIHDAQVFAIPKNFTFAFRAWYQLMLRLCAKTASVVITNSHFSKSELIRYLGTPEQKIQVAWLGVDHVRRLQADAEILNRHGLEKNQYVLAVSSSNPNKNFVLVAKALALLGEDAPRCAIAGQRYDRVFENTAIHSGKITHLGYVSDAELYALYQNASCLLFPSFYEGFGLPPIEAMALGCPAIVSKTSSMPEICADAVVYCDPNDVASLASAIENVVNQPQLRQTLLDHGQTRTPLFSWNKTCDVIIASLHNLTKDAT